MIADDFGRGKLGKAKREQSFSVITAAVSLSGTTDLRPMSKAGIVFNPVESSFFENLDAELRDLLQISGQATGTRYEITDDDHGTRWVVLDDRDFEDLVFTIHLIAETITEHGFGDRLLAAVARLGYGGRQAYWIYNIKPGRFCPFVPSGKNQRGNAAEMRLGARMEEEAIPVEKSLDVMVCSLGDSLLRLSGARGGPGLRAPRASARNQPLAGEEIFRFLQGYVGLREYQVRLY